MMVIHSVCGNDATSTMLTLWPLSLMYKEAPACDDGAVTVKVMER